MVCHFIFASQGVLKSTLGTFSRNSGVNILFAEAKNSKLSDNFWNSIKKIQKETYYHTMFVWSCRRNRTIYIWITFHQFDIFVYKCALWFRSNWCLSCREIYARQGEEFSRNNCVKKMDFIDLTNQVKKIPFPDTSNVCKNYALHFK